MHALRLLCAGALVLASGSTLSGAVVYLQDVDGQSGWTFNGVGVTDTPFDDAVISTSTAALSNDNTGPNQSLQIRTTGSGLVYRALLAVKDLTTIVPTTSAEGDLQINSVTLHLAQGSAPPANYSIIIRRVTTDWLKNPAGDNERRVSGATRNSPTPNLTNGQADLAGGEPWANGGAFGGGGLDFTTTNALNGVAFGGGAYGTYYAFDVTTLVRDAYDAGAFYGLLISTGVVSDTFGNIRSANDVLGMDEEGNPVTFRPVLEVNYEYIPVPEPTSASIVLMAAGAWATGRRRRGNGRIA